ncbi:uncharacterized protein RHOBADRAFT_56610 [Rhodotorula graminis WP1]|uniref:Uncharacterized protein n=1 Tax=Rhodotorula graminis (strain WP1) TaxID=578459 RepID=A0A0P9GFI4_RHOGW|nr:uncharacterized protein RHOBADRAFT_56610 [Rhodotorula graminis WP1]KPV71575.1 hypothetical protein RHOBADRAFT_56610 [Rhodotorula graminis WP1]
MSGQGPVAAEGPAAAGAKQARHGAFLSNALKDLVADVAELDSLVADAATADAPRTRPHFAPFLVSRDSPTWPRVKTALTSTFSSIAEPDLQSVEPGPSGMAAVLFVLESMVDWEADRNSVRQAIYSLSTAVTTATESIRLAAHASAERPQEQPAAPPRQAERLAATPSTREPSVTAPPEQRNATPGPSNLSTPRAAHPSKPAAPASAPVGSRTRDTPRPPIPDATAPQAAISSRTRGSRRASDIPVVRASAADREVSPPRKRRRRSAGRSPGERPAKEDQVEEEQARLEEGAAQERAEEQAPGRVDQVTQENAPRPTGSAVTVPLVSAFLWLPHLLLTDPVTSAPLMDADTSVLGPPADLPTGLDQELVFARPHLDNKQIELINKGTRNGVYTRSRNTLTLKQDMNLCGLSDSRALAPGQPLVLVTSRSKCVAVVEAASRFHDDKDREGINVLLREGEGRWCYKGWYVACRAASVLIPRGPGAASRLESVLRDILEGHCERTNARHGRAKDMLADWGFSGGVTSSAEVMQQLEEDGDDDLVMHYVALRCVEWDADSFDEWSRRRGGRRRR